MNKSRLEAFSDGVFAIIITIMILELKIPEDTSWAAINHLLPKFLCYVLSFVYIAIYWGNHHHMMHTVKRINASIMWSNMHLLFWLSIVPFATGWMGETHFDRVTVAVYAGLLLLSGIAYTILSKAIKKTYKEETVLTRALARDDIKGIVSVVLYSISIPLSLWVHPLLAAGLITAVAVMWVIPSKAIEHALEQEH